jgi:hypothetical protein
MRAHSIVAFKPGYQPAQRFRITSSLESIISFIHSLEDETKLNAPDFVRLKELCFDLVSRLPLPVNHLDNGNFVLRARENKNGEVFSRISDMSYNPITKLIEPGRFNRKKEPVFYCTAPVNSANGSGQITSICEPCKELFDSKCEDDLKYFTIGKLNILKLVKIIVLTFFQPAEQKSPHIGNINPHYVNFLRASCNTADLEKCLRFYTFFSGYAARKYDTPEKYLLTTAFFHALRKYYGTDIDILYSSAMKKNNGLNLALSKELVDDNYLELEGALMFKSMRSKVTRKSYTIVPCTDYALVGNDGRFRFKYLT